MNKRENMIISLGKTFTSLSKKLTDALREHRVRTQEKRKQMAIAKKKKSANLSISISQFKVKGMHCTSCVMNIEGVLEETAGIQSAKLVYATGVLNVQHHQQIISSDQIKQKVTELGYTIE